MHPPSDYRSETWNTQLRRPAINSPRPVNVSSRKEKWLGVCVSVYHVTGFIRRTVALLYGPPPRLKLLGSKLDSRWSWKLLYFDLGKFYQRRYWNVRYDLYFNLTHIWKKEISRIILCYYYYYFFQKIKKRSIKVYHNIFEIEYF